MYIIQYIIYKKKHRLKYKNTLVLNYIFIKYNSDFFMDKIEEAQRFYQKRHWDYIRRFGTLSAERHAIRAEFESTPETTISALTERWKDCCHKDGLCSCPETSDYLEMLKLYDE